MNISIYKKSKTMGRLSVKLPKARTANVSNAHVNEIFHMKIMQFYIFHKYVEMCIYRWNDAFMARFRYYRQQQLLLLLPLLSPRTENTHHLCIRSDFMNEVTSFASALGNGNVRILRWKISRCTYISSNNNITIKNKRLRIVHTHTHTHKRARASPMQELCVA